MLNRSYRNRFTPLQKAQAEVSRLWKLACEDEGIPADSKFVVFTSINKYAVAYNDAARKFFALRAKAVR